jgi:hypothetical protein
MVRLAFQRCLLPVFAATAFLSPVSSQAFIQARYTAAPPTLSVPVLPTAANGPDLPAFGAVSEGEFACWKSCRNDPVSFNDPMGFEPVLVQADPTDIASIRWADTYDIAYLGWESAVDQGQTVDRGLAASWQIPLGDTPLDVLQGESFRMRVGSGTANALNTLGAVAPVGVVAGSSMIPGVGEGQDLLVLIAKDSSVLDRILSGGSLALSVLTLGTSPNYGATANAGKRVLCKSLDATDQILSPGAIMRHPFADGGTHLTTTARLEFWKAHGATTYGSPDVGLFIASKSQIDELLASGATRHELEVALGLDPNTLAKGRLVRIDVDDPFGRGLRLPDPSAGNAFHRPGTGVTLGTLYEGVVDAPRIGTRGVRKSVIRVRPRQ